MSRRTERINSLLREVISEVIRNEVRDPKVHPLLSITEVEITPDLHFAKVLVSVIGNDEQRNATVAALMAASGFIAHHTSRRVNLRHFPKLTFTLDRRPEKAQKIEEIIAHIQQERQERSESPEERGDGGNTPG